MSKLLYGGITNTPDVPVLAVNGEEYTILNPANPQLPQHLAFAVTDDIDTEDNKACYLVPFEHLQLRQECQPIDPATRFLCWCFVESDTGPDVEVLQMIRGDFYPRVANSESKKSEAKRATKTTQVWLVREDAEPPRDSYVLGSANPTAAKNTWLAFHEPDADQDGDEAIQLTATAVPANTAGLAEALKAEGETKETKHESRQDDYVI